MCARLPAKPCQATNQVGLICPAVHELIGLTGHGHVVVSWCFEVLCGARNCSGLIHGMTLLQYINSTKTGDGLSMLWIEYALYAQSLWFSLVVLGSQFDTSHTIQDNQTLLEQGTDQHYAIYVNP